MSQQHDSGRCRRRRCRALGTGWIVRDSRDWSRGGPLSGGSGTGSSGTMPGSWQPSLGTPPGPGTRLGESRKARDTGTRARVTVRTVTLVGKRASRGPGRCWVGLVGYCLTRLGQSHTLDHVGRTGNIVIPSRGNAMPLRFRDTRDTCGKSRGAGRGRWLDTGQCGGIIAGRCCDGAMLHWWDSRGSMMPGESPGHWDTGGDGSWELGSSRDDVTGDVTMRGH